MKAVKRRVLRALGDGAPKAPTRLCQESDCSGAQLVEMANLGFVRFRTTGSGVLAVCVTPKGLAFLATKNALH